MDKNPRVGGSIPLPAIPLKTRRVQQILQQTLAPVEYISCGNSSDGSSKDSVGEGTGDRAFVGASETR